MSETTKKKKKRRNNARREETEEEEEEEKKKTQKQQRLLFARIDEEELLEESDSEFSEKMKNDDDHARVYSTPTSRYYWKKTSSSFLIPPIEEEEEDGFLAVAGERSEQTTSGFVSREEKAEVTSDGAARGKAARSYDENEDNENENDDDPVYRLLRNAQREDEARMKRFQAVPEGFDIALVNERDVSADARLKQLNKLFQREDERIGDISRDAKACFGLVLQEVRTREAVGYALFYDAKVHEWEATKKLTVAPPRLSHLFIKPEFRRRGFGTALVNRWIKEFAIDAKAFAVDMPNGKMLKLLKHARCEVAVEKSGFEAGTIHFLNLPL
jgi:GNAT superfamily N-acetyltransferase